MSMSIQKDPYEEKVAAALGTAMRSLRERRGLQREHIGLVLGCTARTVKSYEEGKRRVSLADFIRICAALTIQVEALLMQLPPAPRILPMGTLDESGIHATKARKHK